MDARATWEIPRYVSYGILAIGSVVVCISAWLAFHRNLDFAWTSIRLAPSFALIHGVSLFSPAETPPWVMVGYGPLYPVAYLPVTVASTPGAVVAIGTLLAHLYILVPAGLLCALCVQRLRVDGAGTRLHWSFLLLLFALIAYAAPSLTYVTSQVHVDAPALGLFLFAAYAILRSEPDDGSETRWLVAAGVCAGLAAACKINLAAASIGFLLWLVLCRRFKAGVKLLLAAGAAGVLVYACAVLRDGFAGVLLNLQLPGRMPWLTYQELGSLSPSGVSHGVGDKVRTLLGLLSDYLRRYGVLALALGLLLALIGGRSATATRMIRLFLLLAAVMVLVSVASVGKSGGDVNSRALVTLPLALAAIFTFAVVVQQANRFAVVTAYAALLGITFVVALAAAGDALRLSIKQTSTLADAYTTISNEPGRWYFPFDPLGHVLAERKFRPNMDVVHSYAAAGAPVEKAAFRSALPPDLQYVAVPPSFASWGINEIRRLLPEYNRSARELETEHHLVLTR